MKFISSDNITLRKKFNIVNSSARFGLVLLMPSIILLGLVVIYPIFKMFEISVTKNNLLKINDTGFVGIENFIWVLKNSSFWNALLNTVILTVASVLIQIAIGLVLAIILTEKFKGRGVLRSAIILPWAVPTVVAASVWVWMYMPSYGIISLFLDLLGFDTSKLVWLGDPKLALFSVMITHAWKGLPIVFLVILANLQTIPAVLYEAEQFMNEYAKEYGLRSLDALHLAACRILQSKDWYFVCADNRLCNIAKLCKINVLNPVEAGRKNSDA